MNSALYQKILSENVWLKHTYAAGQLSSTHQEAGSVASLPTKEIFREEQTCYF